MPTFWHARWCASLRHRQRVRRVSEINATLRSWRQRVSKSRLGEAHTVGSVQDGSVSLDALVLALASVVRLSTVAAVYAMLSAARPIRLLTAYILAGFVVSTGVGIVLVNLLDESIRRRTPDEVPAVIAFVLGAVSLGCAAGLLSRRVPAPVREPTRTNPGLDSHSCGSAVN